MNYTAIGAIVFGAIFVWHNKGEWLLDRDAIYFLASLSIISAFGALIGYIAGLA